MIYLNVDNETLSKLVVKRLQNNKAVFFGSHTPKFMDKTTGVMDIELWNYPAIGYNLPQQKASRIRYHESLMTHAMLITGCHVDETSKLPLRYRVENSWGKDSGKDGLYVMTQSTSRSTAFKLWSISMNCQKSWLQNSPQVRKSRLSCPSGTQWVLWPNK